MRILVTTRAELYEKRKQEHINHGYQISEERPTPVNGFCSFVAVTEPHPTHDLADLIKYARRDSPHPSKIYPE